MTAQPEHDPELVEGESGEAPSGAKAHMEIKGRVYGLGKEYAGASTDVTLVASTGGKMSYTSDASVVSR